MRPEEKLLANPEIAKLIDELGTSTTDANDLVRGMLQASITRGLNAQMDTHFGYQTGDRLLVFYDLPGWFRNTDRL